jgi:uncharacterized protein YdeI (YjbR/CyaY-like superfamily)
MAGYSGTPLVRKLGIRPGMTCAVLDSPPHYRDLLEGVPPDATFIDAPCDGVDFVHLFVVHRAGLGEQLRALRGMMAKNGMVWVSWPKRASRVPTDVTEDVVREAALASGLVDVKVCAVDNVWSGLKLVIRKAERSPTSRTPASDPEPRFFATPAKFRAWLAKNHATADELWVGYYKVSSGRPSITWPESVDEALCYGWIDGLRRSVDGESYRIRFTPRRPNSIWSSVNVRRAQELIDAGRMQPPGLAAFEKRREDLARQYSFEQGDVELGAEYERVFRDNAKAWSWFSSQPPGYRRTATWWVISAKREQTRRRRLGTLISDSAAGQRIGPLRRPDK